MKLHERLQRLEAAQHGSGAVSVTILDHPDFVSIDEQIEYYRAKHPGKVISPWIVRLGDTPSGLSNNGELLKSFDDLGW